MISLVSLWSLVLRAVWKPTEGGLCPAGRPRWPASRVKGLACFFIGSWRSNYPGDIRGGSLGDGEELFCTQASRGEDSWRVCCWQQRWAMLADWRWALMAWQHVGDGQCRDELWRALRWGWIDVFDITEGEWQREEWCGYADKPENEPRLLWVRTHPTLEPRTVKLEWTIEVIQINSSLN